jgi:hypothetical protein
MTFSIMRNGGDDGCLAVVATHTHSKMKEYDLLRLVTLIAGVGNVSVHYISYS